MLAHVRRTRWIVALTLLLFGQVGVVRAAVVPDCPNSDRPAAALSIADAVLTDRDHGSATTVQDERDSTELPALPSSSAPVCGLAALPAESPSRVHGSLSSRSAPPHADAIGPRLLAHFFFRPPRQS
jgi:hypothetical protein